MKDENISSYTLDEIEGQIDETDWERVDKMTDEDLYKTAQSDPDAQPLSETELNCFKRAIYANGEMLWEDEQTVGELLANGEKYTLIPVRHTRGAGSKKPATGCLLRPPPSHQILN